MPKPMPQLPTNQTPNDSEKSMWTLSYRLKGMAVGLIAILAYCYFYAGDCPYKIIIAAGVLGYFVGGLVGSFFFTKKT